MKTKYFCRRCGEQLLGDGGYCFCCRENKGDADVEERECSCNGEADEDVMSDATEKEVRNAS